MVMEAWPRSERQGIPGTMVHPNMNGSVPDLRGQALCRIYSFVALLLVLVLHECSGFAPHHAHSSHSSVQTLRDKPTAAPRTGTASHGTMGLLVLFATEAAAEPSTADTVTSSYGQKYLAEAEASGRALTKQEQKWWAQFQELEEYKREFGDCNVPFNYKINPQLGRWVSRQRQSYQKNNLSSERIEALESIGFEWVRPKGAQPDDAAWWKRFGELEEYRHEHGDYNVPFVYEANSQLGNWVNQQRQRYQKNNLSSERIEALESIGFEWVRPKGAQPDDAAWWKRFGELEEYKKKHGDCNVLITYTANPQLATWVYTQRQSFKKSKLDDERIEALESIDFEWARPRGVAPDDSNWWKRIGELKEYKEKHGDCNVPINYHANMLLANWVMNQRKYYHRFIDENWKQSPGITKERIDALNEIGFEWRLRERPEWDERFDELVAYKNQHGDTLVPMDTRRDSDNKCRELAMWVDTQRQQYRLLQEGKHSHLTDERIEQLNDIGFVWDAQEAAWEERFAELVAYKEMHGDTLVRREGSKLGRWVTKQCVEYQLLQKGKHSTLTNERIKKLDQIGFVWTVFEAAWEERFSELVEFKESYGHADVPKSWENQQLFSWISVQRREYRKLKEGKMTAITEERIERLESIGFQWVSKQTYQWKIRLGELRNFYDENDIVPVPRAEKSLYSWTRTQKKEYSKFVRGEKTNMDEARIKDLESIGFFDAYGIKMA